MGEFSIFHWLIVLTLLANLVPVAKILGSNRAQCWLVRTVFFPLINPVHSTGRCNTI